MSIETMKLALEALEAMQMYAAAERKGLRICDEAIEDLRAAIEQAEKQEPVAWWDGSYANPFFRQKKDSPGIGVNGIPLYTAPPQREWQGLTDREKVEIGKNLPLHHSTLDLAKAIEAKLREKNSD